MGDLVIEMNSLLEEVENIRALEHACIYRVPDNFRRLNEDCFTPKMVSIGPLHSGRPALQSMESYKLLYMKQFRQRISYTIGLDQLIRFVEELGPTVRLRYSEPINLSPRDFAKVILVDSCFIFELFFRYHFGTWDDVVQFKPWLATTVMLDLFLLENQLPFHVLESLYNRVFPNNATNDDNNPSFIRLTFNYFQPFNITGLTSEGFVFIEHFTDLIRTFRLPPLSLPRTLHRTITHIHSATQLIEAGVTFKRSEGTSIMDFRFSKGTFEIPRLEVGDFTETVFRNLLAFEQCHYPSASYITHYIAIMNFLINTSNDVALLVREGIIINWLGEPNSVAKLLNNLWTNLTIENCNYHHTKVCWALNNFCESPWNRMKATLRHDYCRTPWKTAASVGAIVILALSLIQTVCSLIKMVPKVP